MIGGLGMSLYDRLRGVTLADLTQTQLKAVLDGLSIDGSTSSDSTIAAAIYAAKAVQSGLTPQCIQDAGSIGRVNITNTTPDTLVPVLETWRVLGISIANAGGDSSTCIVSLSNGTYDMMIERIDVSNGQTGTVDLSVLTECLLTPDLFLKFQTTNGSTDLDFMTAYQVVQQ